MNFNQLRYILAVDRHRNFARAAEYCGIAQSTLSREIQRLEKEFDIVIFDRSRHPVVPTLKGTDLLHHAQRILEEEQAFISVARQKDNRVEGVFRLGILPVLAPYLIPLFVGPLSLHYRELKLSISEVSLREMEEALEAGYLDGGIVIAPFPKAGFYEHALFDEAFVLYMGESHPLLDKEYIELKDIPTEDLLLHEDVKNYLHFDGTPVNPPGWLKSVTYQNGSFETIRKVIDRNGGLTLLPELACIYMGERRRKMVRPLSGSAISRTISMVTPRGFQKKRLIRAIRNEILENLPVSQV